MNSSHGYHRFFAIIAFLFCTAAPGEQFSQKFKLDGPMMIVPVTINGSGPYNFVLDTGNSDMAVDAKLAAELGLPNAGNVTVLAAEGTAVANVVRLESVVMGGAVVQNINASVMKQVPFHARGVLGEGFLRNFDLLIDNRRHVIEFESGPGELLDALGGERTPFLTHGDDQGRETSRRIIISANIFELGQQEFRLLLDSGSDTLLMFTHLGTNSRPRDFVNFTALQSNYVATQDTLAIHGMQVGQTRIRDAVVVAPTVIPRSDVDGLLPTMMFSSIFISHSGEFVILNPSVRPERKR
jgi:clan AA aspartic protease (TIGR02281 family)